MKHTQQKEWCCTLCRPYKFFDYRLELEQHEDDKHANIILDGKLISIKELRKLEASVAG